MDRGGRHPKRHLVERGDSREPHGHLDGQAGLGVPPVVLGVIHPPARAAPGGRRAPARERRPEPPARRRPGTARGCARRPPALVPVRRGHLAHRENHSIAGHLQRHGGVLLDQHHGGPLLVDGLHDRPRWATTWGARPSDGSSSSSSRGDAISARAMASICCCPPESSPARSCRRSCSIGNSSCTRSGPRLGGPVPAAEPADAEVLVHGQAGEDLAALGDLHHAIADDGGRRAAVEALAVEADRARVDGTPPL